MYHAELLFQSWRSAWFQDGSPSNPITYPVPGVYTLSDHLNSLYYDAMKDKNEFAYGYK